MPRRSSSLVALVALVPLLVAGCFTGKRPSFSTDPFTSGIPTGDPAVDAVLESFDSITTGPFTATYDVLAKFGNTTRTATVAVEPGRRSITIGTVRYLFDSAQTLTCVVDNGCTAGFDPARVSDSGVTVDFYAADTARRLRRDAVAKIAPTITRSDTIGGQPASCVDIGVSGGTAVYCVLASGVLALLDDGDVRVSLTAYAESVDQSAFDQ